MIASTRTGTYSSIEYFREEYLEHLTNGGCPFDPVASTVFAAEGAH
jgi:NADH-quinone oxidoreductase subunit F